MKSYDIVYCGSEYSSARLISSIDSIVKNVAVPNVINFHILDFKISQDKKDSILSLVNRHNKQDDMFVDKSMQDMLTQWGGG